MDALPDHTASALSTLAEAEKPAVLTWRSYARRIFSRKTLLDVVTHPIILWNAGSTLRAYQLAGPIGTGVYAGVTVFSIGIRVYESVTGRDWGMPFSAQVGANITMAAATLYEGCETYGPDQMLTFGSIAWASTTTAAAFSFAAIGNGIRGVREWRKTKAKIVADNMGAQGRIIDIERIKRLVDERMEAKTVVSDEMSYYGLADASAVNNRYLVPFFVAGVLKAIYDKGRKKRAIESRHAARKDDDTTRESVRKDSPVISYVQKHATFARFGALAFMAGGISTLRSDLGFSIVQFLWYGGYIGLDEEKNTDLMHDTRRMARLVRQKIGGTRNRIGPPGLRFSPHA
jgi:hypothetical protein